MKKWKLLVFIGILISESVIAKQPIEVLLSSDNRIY